MLYAQKKLKTSPTWRAVLLNNNVYRTYDDIKDIFVIRDSDKKYYYSEAEQNNKYTLDLNGREYIDYKILRETDGIIFFKVLPCANFDKQKTKVIVEGEIDGKCPGTDANNAANYVFGVSNKAITTFKKTHVSSRLVLTPILHPIKYRPAYSGKEPTLTGEITLSFNLGYRVNLSRNLIRPTYLTVVPYGIGLSTSQYFKLNTDDKPSPGNISLTYLSFGAFLSFDRYNIGIFCGKDAMMTKSQKDWHYQDQRWYSFGLGYSLK
jgi:hypothetical protein